MGCFRRISEVYFPAVLPYSRVVASTAIIGSKVDERRCPRSDWVVSLMVVKLGQSNAAGMDAQIAP